MTLSRISTFALHQSTLREASRVQTELANLQTQLSSGLKSQDFAGIADQSEQFLALERTMARGKRYIDNNNIILTRMDSSINALDQTIAISTELKNLILQRRNPATVTGDVFQEQLTGLWKRLTGALNVSQDGRYLFSGTRSDVAPIDTTAFPSLNVSGETDDDYYLGSRDDITFRADDQIELTYNVRANDEGIQKIFAALAMARQGDAHHSDDDLAAAFTFAEEGVRGVISLQSSVNANKLTVTQINDHHLAATLYWTGIKEDIANADLVAASTQVAINQGLLQASFQTFARITSLKLSDYLR